MSVVISDAWRQRFGGTARLYGEKRCNVLPGPRLRGRDRRGRFLGGERWREPASGAITLIDMDDVCVTNTNRQIHALSGNVGLAKAEVMAGVFVSSTRSVG